MVSKVRYCGLDRKTYLPSYLLPSGEGLHISSRRVGVIKCFNSERHNNNQWRCFMFRINDNDVDLNKPYSRWLTLGYGVLSASVLAVALVQEVQASSCSCSYSGSDGSSSCSKTCPTEYCSCTCLAGECLCMC
jgi:hypothetical protein